MKPTITSKEVKHTPTPLSFLAYQVGSKDTMLINRGGEEIGRIWREDDADSITKAVNSHGALLEAAKDALEFIRNIRENIDEEKPEMPYPSEDKLDLAINQAEGK